MIPIISFQIFNTFNFIIFSFIIFIFIIFIIFIFIIFIFIIFIFIIFIVFILIIFIFIIFIFAIFIFVVLQPHYPLILLFLPPLFYDSRKHACPKCVERKWGKNELYIKIKKTKAAKTKIIIKNKKIRK